MTMSLLIKQIIFSIFLRVQNFAPGLLLKIGLKAWSYDPKGSLINLLVGRLYFHLGDPQSALHHWKVAYRHTMNHKFSHFPLSWIEDYLKLLKEYGTPLEFDEAAVLLFQGKPSFSGFEISDPFIMLSKLAGDDLSRLLPYIQLRLTPVLHELEIVDLSDVEERSLTLSPPSTLKFYEAPVFEESAAKPLRELPVPEQKISYVRQARITNAFQILKEGKFVLYEPAGHPRYGLVSGTWMNFVSVKGKVDHVVHFSTRRPTIQLPRAILISGRSSFNYFHWMIEYLPRLLNTFEAGIDLGTPIIVQAHLPKSMRDALTAVNPGYPVFELNPEQSDLLVDELIIPSFHTFVPDDFSVPMWTGGTMSQKHIDFLRDRVLNQIHEQPTATTNQRKVYLARRGARSVKNERNIRRMLEKKGFEVIFPEKLSLMDQVHLFQTADLIVSASGASLTNIIFMRPGTKVIALTSDRIKDYSLNSNLAAFTGVDFELVTGQNVRPRSSFSDEAFYVHSDYRIDVAKLERCVERCLRSDP